jgi:hypothetical protein
MHAAPARNSPAKKAAPSPLLAGKRTLTWRVIRRRSGDGFDRRTMEARHAAAAEKEAAAIRATEAQTSRTAAGREVDNPQCSSSTPPNDFGRNAYYGGAGRDVVND